MISLALSLLRFLQVYPASRHADAAAMAPNIPDSERERRIAIADPLRDQARSAFATLGILAAFGLVTLWLAFGAAESSAAAAGAAAAVEIPGLDAPLIAQALERWHVADGASTRGWWAAVLAWLVSEAVGALLLELRPSLLPLAIGRVRAWLTRYRPSRPSGTALAPQPPPSPQPPT